MDIGAIPYMSNKKNDESNDVAWLQPCKLAEIIIFQAYFSSFIQSPFSKRQTKNKSADNKKEVNAVSARSYKISPVSFA
jgi:hypothetical protein